MSATNATAMTIARTSMIVIMRLRTYRACTEAGRTCTDSLQIAGKTPNRTLAVRFHPFVSPTSGPSFVNLRVA